MWLVRRIKDNSWILTFFREEGGLVLLWVWWGGQGSGMNISRVLFSALSIQMLSLSYVSAWD